MAAPRSASGRRSSPADALARPPWPGDYSERNRRDDDQSVDDQQGPACRPLVGVLSAHREPERAVEGQPDGRPGQRRPRRLPVPELALGLPAGLLDQLRRLLGTELVARRLRRCRPCLCGSYMSCSVPVRLCVTKVLPFATQSQASGDTAGPHPRERHRRGLWELRRMGRTLAELMSW